MFYFLSYLYLLNLLINQGFVFWCQNSPLQSIQDLMHGIKLHFFQIPGIRTNITICWKKCLSGFINSSGPLHGPKKPFILTGGPVKSSGVDTIVFPSFSKKNKVWDETQSVSDWRKYLSIFTRHY